MTTPPPHEMSYDSAPPRRSTGAGRSARTVGRWRTPVRGGRRTPGGSAAHCGPNAVVRTRMICSVRNTPTSSVSCAQLACAVRKLTVRKVKVGRSGRACAAGVPARRRERWPYSLVDVYDVRRRTLDFRSGFRLPAGLTAFPVALDCLARINCRSGGRLIEGTGVARSAGFAGRASVWWGRRPGGLVLAESVYS